MLPFLVLFNNFLPISLYVTVETVLIFQASFIENDIEMYDEGSDTPASVRTSNLNSDFGQVDFIFSDKTGTLTQNVMKLKQISVNGTIYGNDKIKDSYKIKNENMPDYTAFNDNRPFTLLQQYYRESEIKDDESKGDESTESQEGQDNTSSTYTTGNDEKSKKDAEALDAFFTCLAVCHTVVVEKADGKLTYQAESPDEGALVYSSVPVGYELLDRTANTITVSTAGLQKEGDERPLVPDPGNSFFIGNNLRRYEILAINGFDATRKRMSIVVRDPTGQIILYCKGADNKMLECVKEDTSKETIKTLNNHLDSFARIGLRTLVMGRRYLTEEEYEQWSNTYDNARTSVENRDELLSQ